MSEVSYVMAPLRLYLFGWHSMTIAESFPQLQNGKKEASYTVFEHLLLQRRQERRNY